MLWLPVHLVYARFSWASLPAWDVRACMRACVRGDVYYDTSPWCVLDELHPPLSYARLSGKLVLVRSSQHDRVIGNSGERLGRGCVDRGEQLLLVANSGRDEWYCK